MTLSITVARRLLELSARLGVRYIFTNLGSDHPAFIEAFAALNAEGGDMPKVIVCPHEMTALSAAHGYAMITRVPQLVLVHVDVGTQNLGGSVHNAARARVPAIIVAGLSPVTDNPDRVASRNEFIHYIQDTPRQAEIVAQYMKWCYELRAPEMVDGVLSRAMQIAASEPQGPVYLTGAREIWDAAAQFASVESAQWPAARLGGISPHAAQELHDALVAAERPIVITSYLGRNGLAVQRLVELSDCLAFGVCEVSPHTLSFPARHPHHLTHKRNAMVNEADLILLLDVDVPWIPTKVRPAAGAKIFHIDCDPIKRDVGYWHFPAERVYHADSLLALEQLLALTPGPAQGRDARVRWIAAARERMLPAPALPSKGPITTEELSVAVAELMNERTIVVFEEPSATEIIPTILRPDRPGTYFASGGAGLGWGINAAIGAKLAKPDAEIIALVGDGCYIFGVPSSAYWVASTYKTPMLTIIYNNGGWHSPKLSTLWVHPNGMAKRNDNYWVTIGSGSRLADIAAAAATDVAAFTVDDRESLKNALAEAMSVVRAGRSAVVDVRIAPISAQVLG